MKLVIQIVTDDDKETPWKFVVTDLKPFEASIMHRRLMDLVNAQDNVWM